MGPIQQLDPASEYSPEELEVYQQKTELSPDDLDEQLVTSVFDDPTYIPTREEYFTARDAKARLKAEGKLPGLLEDAATGATGFIQTLADMGHEILDDPGDFLARSPATMLATVRKSWRNTNDVARWLRSTNRLDPIGRDEQTGEFIFGQTGAGMDDADYLARQQQLAAEQGRKIRPVNEEDLKDYEYDFFLSERARQKELEEWVASTTAPTEFVTMLVTGRNQVEQPMQATSDIAGGLVEATNVATMGVPLSAGAKSLGFSRVAKAGGSRAARLLEKAAQTGIEGMETGAARFQNLIQKTTRLAPETQTKIAKWSAAGGVGGAAFGMESQIPGVSQLQDGAKVIGGAYLGYKLGLGTLRTVQKVAGPTSTILRVAADPADGLDPIAQASVATKLAAFPELAPVREVLENPTKFRAIESTPARLAADPRLGPQTRAVMEGLANPLVVQGVRGASAVAGGAVKGAAANTPFVALAMNAEEDKAAANMLGIGGAFGAAGGAMSRIGGVRQRRAEARVSDIGRMFMDVELAGGDVAGLAKTYSPQQLGDMAAMQGIFRNRVEFVPLAQADYDLNVQANGGAGSAGLFVQAPPGEKARVFVNLDARRDGIAPHEFGHALLSSGALGGAQAAEIRANVNRRYTQAGVEARATEYARNLIAAQNEKAFPGQNLPISQDAIQAKIDELGQSGLMRGDMDTLDWVRDELFAEEFRTASANLDFAAIRRGMPADGSWLGSMEKVLGGHANALSISGVRIDPATGAPIDTPQSLFRDNPILAADKTLIKNLDTYIKNYRQWVNHPDQSKPRGVRVAPTARPQDLANNPQVTFHDLGNGVRGNDFAILDPATGQPMLRSQAEINAETLKRQQQMRSLVGSKLLPATDPNLGPKKTADGRVTIRGRVLPQQFDFLNGFAQHIRGFGRQFEQHAARGESMQVRYHAIGSGDTGAFRIKNLGNLEAITREVIPWGWELTSKGNLMASMLDLTQFRNRALRAINQGDPQMQALFGNDMAQVEATLKQWMDNHRQDLPGDNKIGSQKRDAINALVGIATNINRNANPFSGKIGGPGSAIKQFRLDRVDTAAGTGRQGFHFDYDKANGNLLPEVATPLPNLSSDIPVQAMSDSVPVRFSNKDFIIRPAGLVSMPGQAFPAYHGTPHKVDRFSTEKIGTGEGAQAYGWGLYFAENEKVAAEYRDALAYKSRRKLYDGGEFNADNPSHVAAFLGEEGVKEFVETGFVDWADTEGISKDQAQKALDWIKSGRQVAKYELTPPSSNLYTVDLDVEPQDLLDWDKPLSEQSEKVQQAVAKARGDIKDWRMAFQDQQSGLWGRTGAASYMDIQLARKVDMAGASKALLAAGIPGIRYLDQGSRAFQVVLSTKQGEYARNSFDTQTAAESYAAEKQAEGFTTEIKREGTYNYVIFDEKLIKITNENGTPVTPQGQAMPDAVDADAIGLSSAKFLREAVGDGMENLRQKLAKRPGTGIAKNKFVRFQNAEGKPIYIGAIQKDGGKSFAGWIEETEAWQTPSETDSYRQWYAELKGHFTEIFGAKAGEMMMAWLAAQQNVSPGGALGNVFKVEDRLAGIGTGKKGGLADGKIEGILLRQVPEKGFGQKLTDFVDAGFLREFRTYMGSKPEGGRPFVADVHTGRDSGHVDQQTLTRLADQSEAGNLFIDGQPATIKITETKTVQVGGKSVKVPERIKVSVPGKKSFEVFVDQRGSPSGGQYEGISEWGNAMTDYLNKINWRGGNWTPAEVQAVGWMRVLRQYGLAEPTVLSALQQNTAKIFAEVNYGSGNLLPANFPAFDTLSPDVQRAITGDVLTDTVNEVANLIGGSLRVQKISAATGAWGNFRSPTTAIEVLGSAEATDLLGLALATVSEQAATMSATFGVGGKDSRVLVFKKADGSKFSDAEMQSIIDDAGISGYTMQHLPGGDAGLIADATKDFKPKGLTENRTTQMTQKLVAWSEKTGIPLEVEDTAARITSYGNDWKTNTDGQSYLSALVERGGSKKIRDIVRFRRRYAEILQQAFERHAPGIIPNTPAAIKPFQAAVDAPSAEVLKMFSP